MNFGYKNITQVCMILIDETIKHIRATIKHECKPGSLFPSTKVNKNKEKVMNQQSPALILLSSKK